jgi:CofD-related protein of GAK system
VTIPSLRVTKSVRTPDPLRLARYRKAPELGPKVLLFSGGSALKDLSREMVRYTHNSIHIITPFDSGGSSAVLRKAFGMPAVGDLRNRIMALADRSVKGNPPIFELFAHRFPKQAEPGELEAELLRMAKGKHPLIDAVPETTRSIIRSHLRFFLERMPTGFDLRGASIGNLILAGGYFNNRRHIETVIYLFARLVEARGIVRPVINQDLHLAAELEDGRTVVGQHLLTGKEVPPLDSAVKRLFLSSSPDVPEPEQVTVEEDVAGLIRGADLICYPMGSFYSSVVANLLPEGVGRAVASAKCPKVFVPNPTFDPEQIGLSLAGSVRVLLDHLERGCGGSRTDPDETLLDFLLIDSKGGAYPETPDIPMDLHKIRNMGVEVIDVPLITPESRPFFDSGLLLEQLLSLA